MQPRKTEEAYLWKQDDGGLRNIDSAYQNVAYLANKQKNIQLGVY